MSSNTVVSNTGNQMFVNSDTSKVFIYNNRYMSGSITNSLYDSQVLREGTLMGRVTGTQKVTPLIADYTDGRQLPIGVLACDITIEAGVTKDVPICIYGDVVKDLVILQDAPTETLDTIVAGQSLYDRVQQIGIKLVNNTEMTGTDNV